MCIPNCSAEGCDQPASVLDMDALRCKSHHWLAESHEAIARVEASLARAQAALDRMEASGKRTGVSVGRAINAASRGPRGGAK